MIAASQHCAGDGQPDRKTLDRRFRLPVPVGPALRRAPLRGGLGLGAVSARERAAARSSPLRSGPAGCSRNRRPIPRPPAARRSRIRCPRRTGTGSSPAPPAFLPAPGRDFSRLAGGSGGGSADEPCDGLSESSPGGVGAIFSERRARLRFRRSARPAPPCPAEPVPAARVARGFDQPFTTLQGPRRASYSRPDYATNLRPAQPPKQRLLRPWREMPHFRLTNVRRCEIRY